MKKSVFLFVGLALTAVAAWADPLLRIGFLTDTHVDTTAQSLALVRSAFDLFKAQGVDVVVHGGDLANKHYAGGYQAYQQAFAEAFAGVTAPREIFAYGNHTSYGDPSGTLGWAEAFADKRTQLGGESVNAAFDQFPHVPETCAQGEDSTIAPTVISARNPKATVKRFFT